MNKSQMETLRGLRMAANKTTNEVAEKLGVTQSAIIKYENGKRKINIEQVLILAKLYDVTAEEVIIAQLSERPKI